MPSLNNGAGVFTNSGQALGSYSSQAVALGDVDGDLDLDAMIGNNGANKLWKNNGSGTFTDSGQTPGAQSTFGVALGDVDGDLDLDAYFANGSGSGDPDEVWINDGLGSFTNSGQSLGDDYSFSVVLFHCDGDSDLDAFVGNNVGQPNVLSISTTAAASSAPAASRWGSAAPSRSPPPISMETPTSTYSSPTSRSRSRSSSTTVSVSSLPAARWCWAGAPPNRSVPATSTAMAISMPSSVPMAASSASCATTAAVLSRTTTSGWRRTAFRAPWRLKLADFDGDFDLDLWTGLCCAGGGATDDPADRIWTNDGTGHFTDSGQLLGSDYTTDGAIGDVDGDLDLDIVAANYDAVLLRRSQPPLSQRRRGELHSEPAGSGHGDVRRRRSREVLDADADFLDILFARLGEPRASGATTARVVSPVSCRSRAPPSPIPWRSAT